MSGRSPSVSGLDGLAVDDAGTGLARSARGDANITAKEVCITCQLPSWRHWRK